MTRARGARGRPRETHAKLLADGLKPDAMMYGCLMKFTVGCDRMELSRELSE